MNEGERRDDAKALKDKEKKVAIFSLHTFVY
jgi:hypothetical protein